MTMSNKEGVSVSDDRVFMNFPMAMRTFATRTDERTIPWLLLIPAPNADFLTVSEGASILRKDGWDLVLKGDTPGVDTWSVRVVGTSVYVRQHGGEPNLVKRGRQALLVSDADTTDEWVDLVVATKKLYLCFNPLGTMEDPMEKTILHVCALCACIPLEN
jgi:hypothetical protein